MNGESQTNAERPAGPRPSLGLWDTTILIVGIVVGVGIFETPATIFHNTLNLWQALGLWVLGGFLTLMGALCFAELASAYPRSGGEYVYLSRAFGSWMGFVFAWAQFAIIRPAGTIGVIAFLFAIYTGNLLELDKEGPYYSLVLSLMGVGAIVGLTALNIVGVRFGTAVQNLLTGLKVLGIAGVIVAGCCLAGSRSEPEPQFILRGTLVHASRSEITIEENGSRIVKKLTPKTEINIEGKSSEPDTKRVYGPEDLRESMFVRLVTDHSSGAVVRVEGEASVLPGLVTALVLVLWSYGGWHEAGYVVSEIQPKKGTIPLSLVLGTTAILVIYLLMNLAYSLGLGFDQSGESDAIASTLLKRAVGDEGAALITLIIIISCLGALNGTLFTTSRIYTEMGVDHPLFAPLGKWNPALGTPVSSLICQGVVSAVMVAAVGIWFQGMNGLVIMALGTAAVFWLFFFLTGVALVILRVREPDIARPFRVPLYPLVPILFCLMCLGMVWSSITYKPDESLIGLVLLAAGIPLYLVSEFVLRPLMKRPEATANPAEKG